MTKLDSRTIALDPVTMAKALTRLAGEISNGSTWETMSDEVQERFLTWYHEHKGEVEELKDLKTEASSDAAILNKFLTDNGFEPMFREIGHGGYGAAAILDMLVEWKAKASRTMIFSYEGLKDLPYPAFEVPDHGIEVFDVPGQKDNLVRLDTKDGSAVWVMMADQPDHELDLLELAMQAMSDKRPADRTWIDGAIVPMIDISTSVPLEWMIGVNCGSQYIDQAFQQFKVRMNEEGARAKVATGFATRGMSPKPITFDQPFAGWFTQAGSELPIALFYAAHDSWKSAGSLSEL
ncbi:MAG TPA: hypothetical protein VFH06_03145 [Candidatus Saccharimonadales bacterium]|nr:hypothetical protein [Candidatus Saccharimonadales bacterium]